MSNNESNLQEKIPKGAKISYGTASSAHVYISGIGLGLIDLFYLTVLGLDPALMAISWLLFIVWNMINDPLIGILQDKTKTNIGRRIPYLRYGAPIYTIAFIWIWFPFATKGDMLFFNHLLMLFVFDTVYSMMGLIFYSMPAEMAITSKERGNIMLYTTALGSIGTLGSVLVPFVFFGGEVTPEILTSFRLTMIVTGIAAGLIIFICSYFIKEKEYTQMEETLGFKDSIKETFKNKPFLIMEVGIFSMVVMQQIFVSYFIFLFNYVVVISGIVDILLFLVLILIVGYSIFWLNTHIEEYGLKKLMMIGAIIAVVGFTLLLILGISLGINQKNKMPFVLMFVPLLTIVFGLVGFMLLSQPLMADCIDHDEILTGKRRETTYSGVNALLTKPAVSIGHALFLWIIALYGYNETIKDPSKQALSVGTGVIIAFTLIPIICMIIGIIALYFYPLDDENWAEQKKKLQEIHIQKEKDYFEYLKKEGKV